MEPQEIGIISDTHGLLRPEALEALRGVSLILHAGDVGGPEILQNLAMIAPVHAVRGNTDSGPGAGELPLEYVVPVNGCEIYMRHILEDLDLDPAAAGFAAVITGHTHKPKIAQRDGVVYLNPGAAGHRRFNLPATVARAWVEPGRFEPRIIELEPAHGKAD